MAALSGTAGVHFSNLRDSLTLKKVPNRPKRSSNCSNRGIEVIVDAVSPAEAGISMKLLGVLTYSPSVSKQEDLLYACGFH